MPGGNLHSHLFESPSGENTNVYNRPAILSMLFRETDRAQRMNTSLCLFLFWVTGVSISEDLSSRGLCDRFFCQVGTLVSRQLRSYDILGRLGDDEFLAILPGCRSEDAALLAERLRINIFGRPLEAMQFSACFGIASSEGRSPMTVLREASHALQKAREAGPGTIFCFESGLCAPSDSFDLESMPKNERQGR